MSNAAGWFAITLAILALGPSFVPGAISVFGLFIAMLAIVVSLFSVKKNGARYFGITTAIALAGVFLVNDALRVWDPLPMPRDIKLVLYTIMLCVVAACAAIAFKRRPGRDDKNSTQKTPP